MPGDMTDQPIPPEHRIAGELTDNELLDIIASRHLSAVLILCSTTHRDEDDDGVSTYATRLSYRGDPMSCYGTLSEFYHRATRNLAHGSEALFGYSTPPEDM